MTERLRLVEPSADYRSAYMAFYEEWIDSGEDIVPWTVEKEPEDFDAFLAFLYAEDSEEKLTNRSWVPHSTYWLIDGQEQVVGAVNIRHRLNEKLRNSGGHIGYGIRPSARGRGYAKRLLALALDKTRALGLDRVLVVCDAGNVASERTILSGGGVRDDDFTEPDGNVIRRFWIDLQAAERSGSKRVVLSADETDQVLRMGPEQLAGLELACSCGATHRVELRKLLLEHGALGQTPGVIRELGLGGDILLVADEASYGVAGGQLAETLRQEGFRVKPSLYPGQQWYADEQAIVRVLIDLEPDTDLLIAVGTGTINDIVRFVSFKVGLPYIVIATAPSMDGYASTGSPILVSGYKKTYPLCSPAAIVGDLDVLCQAPADRIAAGAGDMLAKLTALCDWQLAAVVQEEPYCETVANLTLRALERVIAGIPRLSAAEPEAVRELMEGLVLSGIAMQMIGHSRPASGSEHHLSHFWEMRHFAEGHLPELHGIKVGVATPLMMQLYDRLLALEPDGLRMKEKTPVEIAEWAERIRGGYGALAEEIIRANRSLLLPQAELDVRLHRLREGWNVLRQAVGGLLSLAPDVKALLRQVGAPDSPAALGIQGKELRDALLLSKEVRPRYTVLQLADQLGELEPFAEEITVEGTSG